MAQTYKTQENEHIVEIPEIPQSTFKAMAFKQMKYLNMLVGLAIAALAAVFCFHKLGVPSIWFDEAFSVELARQPLPLLLHLISGPEPNMELYYLLLHFWLQLTGLFGLHQTEFVVRFPSAVCAVASSVVIFLLGRRFIGLLGGTLAAVLFVLNDLQLIYAQQTRSYALQVLLLCIATYALLNLLSRDVSIKRWWICYTTAMVLAIYAHLFSLLVLLAQLLALAGILLLPNAWQQRARQQWKLGLINYIVLGVLIIPMLYFARHGSKTGWLPIPGRGDVYHFFTMIAGYDNNYLALIVLCVVAGVVLALGTYIVQHSSQARQLLEQQNTTIKGLFSQQERVPLFWLLLCWLVVPIVVSFVVSHGSLRLFSTRYLVVIVPALFLLVGASVSALRNRGLQTLLALELIFLAYMTVPLYYRSAQVEDWNSTSRWLIQRYQSGDGLVCYDNSEGQGCQISMEYYLHAYPQSGAQFTDDSPGAFSWEKYNYSDAPKALDTNALATYGAKHAHLFFIVARVQTDAKAAQVQQVEQWLDHHFHFTDQIVAPTVTIRLYTT